MKRAQGLPINTIIIAALALVVLFILIGIVGFRTQKFGKEVGEAAKFEVCPATNVCSVTKCESPLTGNYGKKQGDTVVRLGFNEVCCEKACKEEF